MLEMFFLTLLASTRQPAVAGSFYPLEKEAIFQAMEQYTQDASPAPTDVSACIVPHAGWRFSGHVVGKVLGGLKGRKFTRVILMGTSHYGRHRGCSVGDYDAYETPLGKIFVDKPVVKALLKDKHFHFEPSAHQREHALEVILPFVQVFFPKAKIVPLLPGQNAPQDYPDMAKALLPFLDHHTLIICAVDFTHYGPNYGYVPFEKDVALNIRNLDMGAFHLLEKGWLWDFFAFLQLTQATICGRFALPFLGCLYGENPWKLVTYTTSGEVMGDWTNSVSYVGAWIRGKPFVKDEDENLPLRKTLTQKEGQSLVHLARSALKTLLFQTSDLADALLTLPHTSPFADISGVFVTINKKGNLRGCIGHIVGREPLYRGVIENTLNASRYDYRFRPIQREEYPDLTVEVSVLSPLKKVNSYRDIQLGTHGVVLEKDGRRAVYLPQVATETGWDLATFLSHLSEKAGLPPDAWKEGATFQVFTAQVFHE